MDWAVLETIGAIAVASIWPIEIAYGKIKELKKAQGIQMRIREIQGIHTGDVLYMANTAIYPQFAFSSDAEENISEILYYYQKACREHFLKTDFENLNKAFSELSYDDFFVASFYEYLVPICSRDDPQWFPKRCLYLDFNSDSWGIPLYNSEIGGGNIPNTLCIDLHKLYLAFYRIAANKNLIQGYREPDIIKRIKDLEQSTAGKISD